jgi:hypothetical protein
MYLEGEKHRKDDLSRFCACSTTFLPHWPIFVFAVVHRLLRGEIEKVNWRLFRSLFPFLPTFSSTTRVERHLGTARNAALFQWFPTEPGLAVFSVSGSPGMQLHRSRAYAVSAFPYIPSPLRPSPERYYGCSVTMP